MLLRYCSLLPLEIHLTRSDTCINNIHQLQCILIPDLLNHIVLNILQTAVGMLREVVESEHQVFVFKLVVFLLAAVEKGGRDNVLRFIRSGGATVLVPLVVLSLSKVRPNLHKDQCEGLIHVSNSGDAKWSNQTLSGLCM